MIKSFSNQIIFASRAFTYCPTDDLTSFIVLRVDDGTQPQYLHSIDSSYLLIMNHPTHQMTKYKWSKEFKHIEGSRNVDDQNKTDY